MDLDRLRQARSVAGAWLAQLASAVETQDSQAVAALFHDDGYWRDVLAITRDLRTLSGPAAIAIGLDPWLPRAKAASFVLEDREPELYERRGWGWVIEVFFRFDTEHGHGRGHLRLLSKDVADGTEPFDADSSATWAVWTVLSVLEELKGFEDPSKTLRPLEGGPKPSRRPNPTNVVDVLVIGAGHAGLTLAARLRQLGLRAVVVEQHDRVGDNWRNRYASLVLHNQVWANHMPYLPFPENWPVYLDKGQMGDWLEHYASLMGIDVLTSTRFDSGRYDDTAEQWNATLVRTNGTRHELVARHIVLASGVFGPVHRPSLPGIENFTGTITYSTDYQGGDTARDRRVLVVGSGSSAHDIAQDLIEHGAQVTMLQRSTTCVVSLDPGAAKAYAIYSESGMPVDDCDIVNNSFPLPLLARVHQDLTRTIAAMDSDLHAGLTAAGFGLDLGDDGSGFLLKFLRRGGGYYINVGASNMIISGQIAIKQGAVIDNLSNNTVTFSDGSTLDVDDLVIATGFDNMSETVRALFGEQVADRVGPIWGLDSEGELRAMWRPTGQPRFWIMGGSLQQCRPYSKYLALQIKAQEELLWM